MSSVLFPVLIKIKSTCWKMVEQIHRNYVELCQAAKYDGTFQQFIIDNTIKK